jgi:hypothetical protein
MVMLSLAFLVKTNTGTLPGARTGMKKISSQKPEFRNQNKETDHAIEGLTGVAKGFLIDSDNLLRISSDPKPILRLFCLLAPGF